MKYLKTVLVLLLLAGLPIGSWLFLKSGLNWRKDKVSDLKTKDLFFNAFDFSKKDKDKLYELMAHRTCVVKIKGEIEDLDEALIDQFEDAYTFQYISFEKTVDNTKSWSSKSAVRFYQPESSNARFDRLKNVNYAIVDTTGYVRQYYEGSGKQVMNTMVEDIAVILPRKKEKDIAIRKK